MSVATKGVPASPSGTSGRRAGFDRALAFAGKRALTGSVSASAPRAIRTYRPDVEVRDNRLTGPVSLPLRWRRFSRRLGRQVGSVRTNDGVFRASGHQGGFLDDLWWLARGFIIGLAVAIPVGPIALLCMRRTLERRFLIGFGTGVGAAVADLFYASIAAFGISAIETILLRIPDNAQLHRRYIPADPGGADRRRQRPRSNAKVNVSTGDAVTAFASGFVLTATNPLTVLGFVAIFRRVRRGPGTDRHQPGESRWSSACWPGRSCGG